MTKMLQIVTPQPHIPESLTPYYDNQAQEAHYRMAHKSLEMLLGDMPEVKVGEIVGGKRLLYAEMPAIEDGDNNEALVLSLPYGQSWKPHMYLRARYLQEGAAPHMRLIVLPNNSARHKAYELSEKNLERVERGDITPIAEQQARLLKSLSAGRLALTGYSFGGMNVGVLARVLKDDAELLTLGIFEPTNVMIREPKELTKAFTKTGLQALRRAVEDAQIPALSKAMSWSNLGLDVIKFGIGTFIDEENSVLKQAMPRNSLQSDLIPVLKAQPNTGVLLAAGEKSLVTPPEQLYFHYDRIVEQHDNTDMLVVESYGHEMGDNIIVHGLLGKAALSRSRA